MIRDRNRNVEWLYCQLLSACPSLLFDGAKAVKRYINGVAIVTQNYDIGNSLTSTDTLYLYKDHLGSMDFMTDEFGTIQQEMSFDAWGKRRNAVDWASLSLTLLFNFDSSDTTRGYTGHEMLDEVGLVHMNGRIYDPHLARFVQADPFVQTPTDTQSLNRYSYLTNNPLNATDPSGFLSLTSLIDAVVAVVSVVVSYFCAPCGAAIANAYLSIRPVLAFLEAAYNAYSAISAFQNGNNFTGALYAFSSFTKFKNGIPINKDFNDIFKVVTNESTGGTMSSITGFKFANAANTGSFQMTFGATGDNNIGTDIGRFLQSPLAYNAAKKLDKKREEERPIYIAQQRSFFDNFGRHLPSVPQGGIDFFGGLGDALLLGFGDNLRGLLNVDGGIDRSSDQYFAGELTSFAAGGLRLVYAGSARLISVAGRSIGGLEGARFASAARNQLKGVFRFGFFRNFRNYPFSSIAARYNNDAAAIISAAGRTSPVFSKGGGVLVGGAAANELDR